MGDLEGDYKWDLEGDLLLCQAQVSYGPGQVWISLELKFNSSELDPEVGRLVIIKYDFYSGQ